MTYTNADHAGLKTEWDFSRVYTGIQDPQVEKDLESIVKKYSVFAKKYADKKFVKTASALAASLKDWELLNTQCSPVCLWFLELQKTIDSGNVELQAKIARLSDVYTKAAKELIFYTNAISKIDVKKQKAFLADKKLAPYKYLLKLAFAEGKYALSDAEEKILAEKSAVSHDAWITMQDTYENKQTVRYGKKIIPLSEAVSIKADLPRASRRALHKEVMGTYKKISFVAEAELNAIIRNKMIDDQLRGYKTPYESTILGYQNDVKTIENLVEVVTASNDIAHRFFTLKAKVINSIDNSPDTNITMAELSTGMATVTAQSAKISFEKAVQMVTDAFAEADPDMGDVVQKYVSRGQIDVFPRQGKTTGGFCAGISGCPDTYILLNYAGKLNDVSTLAHEMGHAIHTDLSRSQPVLYRDYTISVAEVASTFFENILFDKLLERASVNEKKDLMLSDIQGRIFTIHAQVAYFQFEKKLHAAVKEKGYVSKEEMAEMFAECRRSYTGSSMDVTTDDGYAFVYISHFRSFFYVYSYAYGQLIADALYAEYKKDKSFIKKVKVFLQAGGSMSPTDIFKKLGIDTTKPDFFKKGLDKLEQDIINVEKLID